MRCKNALNGTPHSPELPGHKANHTSRRLLAQYPGHHFASHHRPWSQKIFETTTLSSTTVMLAGRNIRWLIEREGSVGRSLQDFLQKGSLTILLGNPVWIRWRLLRVCHRAFSQSNFGRADGAGKEKRLYIRLRTLCYQRDIESRIRLVLYSYTVPARLEAICKRRDRSRMSCG